MTWNYRVFKTKEGEFEIMETYYKNGKPYGYCNVGNAHASSLRGLKWSLEKMIKATKKKILKEEDF